MTDPIDVLALSDFAATIERLQRHLHTRSAHTAGPTLSDVCGQVRSLALTMSEISEELTCCLFDAAATQPTVPVLAAYGSALESMAQAVTELGHLQSEIITVHLFPDHPSNRSTSPFARPPATEEMRTRCGAVDRHLAMAAEGLRTAAARLSPHPPDMQAAAHVRSPQARPTQASAPGPPSSAALPATGARTAKGR